MPKFPSKLLSHPVGLQQRVFAATLVWGAVWNPTCDKDCVGHSPVGAKRNPQDMRGCHDPAGVRAVGRREMRVELLVSERNREPNRQNRTGALPLNGLMPSVAIRNKAQFDPEGVCRAFAMLLATPRNRIPSSQPDEPSIDPLYLFACSLSWRKLSNTTAGWELVRCLRSSGQTARIAAAFLAQAERVGLVRVPVRTIQGAGQASPRIEAGLLGPARWWL